MKVFKLLFQFSKQQQLCVLVLIVLIVIIQCVYFFVDFSLTPIIYVDENLKRIETQIDSLRQIELAKTHTKIYPFNPNYITDYKGYTLGMSTLEIDRLFAFRKKNKWVNSAKEFQNVTQVSDSLLHQISPFFKFPEWVKKQKAKTLINQQKKQKATIGLNSATAKQLQAVNGVGEVLSKRIIAYRNKFKGGFINWVQLQNIYGLTPEVIEKIKVKFPVLSPRLITKLNLNTVTKNQLVGIEHIDYELAHDIIEQRTLRDGYKTFEELTKVKDFPIDKLDIIKLYLELN